MKPFSANVAVGDTSPVRILSFLPNNFHSVIIRNDRSHADVLYVGAGGVSIGDGFDLAAGEVLSFTYADFDALRLRSDELVTLYGISGSGVTAARVFGFIGGV